MFWCHYARETVQLRQQETSGNVCTLGESGKLGQKVHFTTTGPLVNAYTLSTFKLACICAAAC